MTRIKKISVAVFVSGFLLCAWKVPGQVRLPKLISDGMILQQNSPIKIWGWAAAGEKLSVDFRNKKFSATTGNDGKWVIQLPSMKAGGPYEMEITASNKILVKDILIGEVWLCSGQSNMELPMERVKDRYPDVVAHAANSNIRQFNVATRYDLNNRQENLVSGTWEPVNPQSIPRFSAVGYFFANALYEKYKVPIGIIKCAVGGSPAEAWLSKDALKQFPTHLEIAEKFESGRYADSVKQSDNAASNAWYHASWKQDKGMQEQVKWYDSHYDAGDWSTMQLPGYWDEQGLKNTNGVVWFRKVINVPESMAGKTVKVRFGNAIDRDSMYVNGVLVGTTGYQYPPRKYTIPAGLLKSGKNTIAIKVINNAGRGGFYKGKPYYMAAVNDTIELAGSWQYKLSIAMQPSPATTTFNYLPGGLFNAMIAPLLNYSIRGVIWYQGESNTGRANEYEQLFPAVINNWRKEWRQKNFPFLYVQLANYLEPSGVPAESQWAVLRNAQLKTLQVANTAMVVATDLGEWNDIHPLNKEDVGRRLALAAMAKAYGDKTVVYSGPLYQSAQLQGNKMVLSFIHAGAGLTVKGDSLNHFAISGQDGKFVWAHARVQGNKVSVWNDSIPKPVKVRYAWANNPEGANLYNRDGLPASPFETDKIGQ